MHGDIDALVAQIIRQEASMDTAGEKPGIVVHRGRGLGSRIG